MLGRNQTRGARGQPQHHRHVGLPAKHVADFRHLVDHLIHRTGDKIHVHDLGHRAHATQGGSDRSADNPGFRNRRLPNASGKLLGDPSGNGIRAAVGNDVFTHDENGFVPGHFFVQRFPQRVAHIHLCHDDPSSEKSRSRGDRFKSVPGLLDCCMISGSSPAS